MSDEGSSDIGDGENNAQANSAGGDEVFLNHSVRELELSIRSENSLMRGGIHTIGDLLQKSRDDLLNIRNLGKKSLTEIEKKITKAGLTLRDNSAEPESSTEKTQEAQEAPDGESQEQESSGNNEKEE